MAGTHVRVRSPVGPTRSGLKSRLAAASARVGQRAGGSGCFPAGRGRGASSPEAFG